jgi:hypothetical protein
LSTAAAALTTPATGRDTLPRRTSFKAPLLSKILDGGDPERREVVLDLGVPSESLLDRLSSTRRCRVEIADLAGDGGIAALNRIDTLEEPDDTVIQRMLPKPGGEPLDLVLCWDLPNYLTRATLQRLFDAIGLRAAPGCRLHMLIAYSKREMPAAPARYVPAPDQQLVQICKTIATSAAPRYSPEDLAIVVGRFQYERGVLLANGMQEFVYTWPDRRRAAKRQR